MKPASASILSEHKVRQFREDGYVVVPQFFESARLHRAANRFEALFRGEFPTGVEPDEWNWRAGRDADDLTRQICNGWKSDPAVAAIVLDRRIGEAIAQLMDWAGARLNQDNVIWKPPGAKALGFHQDDAYQQWIVPPAMASCWLALDPTTADGGTIEYARGSHQWPVGPPIAQFHAPDDYTSEFLEAARAADVDAPQIDKLELDVGDAVFHHGATWHGSGVNRGQVQRRALVAHCMSGDAHFHPHATTPVYSRYKRFGSTEMDESFFPLLWHQTRPRSPFIDTLVGR